MSDFSAVRFPAVFPAIDLRGGRCVRLVRGARSAEIHYDDDPVRVAERWRDAGASCLHVIDLGAAFGEADSTREILRIASAVDLPIQTGGGIRDTAKLEGLLEGGVARAILGTRAFRDPEFLARAVERHGPERIIVSMDCEGDRVKIAGWEEDSPLGIEAALGLVDRAGVRCLLVTATDRDGTLEGPRLDLVRRILESSEARVVAAGGIGSVEDIRAVLRLRHPRLEGVVVGRALYEGRVDLREALAAAGELRSTMQSPNLEPVVEGIKYDASGLVPAVVQDVADGQVLMVAYMNKEALRRTLADGVACFWSRSRQEYWVKGATSGNTQKVVRVAVDCDKDCILVVVEQQGDKVACHTGNRSCFYTEIVPRDGSQRAIDTRRPIFGR